MFRCLIVVPQGPMRRMSLRHALRSVPTTPSLVTVCISSEGRRFCASVPSTPPPKPPIENVVKPTDFAKPPLDGPTSGARADEHQQAATTAEQPQEPVNSTSEVPPPITDNSSSPADPHAAAGDRAEPTPPPKVDPPKPLPRGFEAFHDPIFPSATATTPEVAYKGVSTEEAKINEIVDDRARRHTRRSRLIVVLIGVGLYVGLFSDWSFWTKRVKAIMNVVRGASLTSIDHYEKTLAIVNQKTSGDDQSEEESEVLSQSESRGMALRSLKERTASVFVSLSNHTALHYDDNGNPIGTSTFIDLESFKAKLASWLHDFKVKQKQADGSEVEHMERRPIDVLYMVPSYFPFAAIAFLWLLPLLAGVHRSLNGGPINAAAAKGMKRPSRPSRFKLETNVKTKLDDVAGLTEVKHEVTEIVDFLKNPARYCALGARVPRGVLIDGPPGVGKTLLAKAVAGEAKLPFISCSGSEFDEVYVGVGAKRVRELFETAKKHKPCIVFIDEIDTFGRKRRNDRSGSSRATINALLNELDGFHDASGIMVLAATNRADTLDEALTRSGRFDRKVSVDLPPHKDRVAIAKVHLKPIRLHGSLAIDAIAETLATMTPGCSGAEIYNICNEAAITASRLDKESVDLECFYKAMDRIMIGMEKRAKKLTPTERERLAYHEAGHVVLAWFQETTDPVLKTSISPRGGKSSGVTKNLPTDRYISTQTMLREKMISLLGGYVSEEFFFEDISSGAADDLRRVTDMATHEVTTYGMAPKTVGHFGWQRDEYALQRPYGDAKANVIDKTVHEVADEVVKQARELLAKHLTQVRIVAGLLMKNETVTARELWLVLGERPHMTKEFRQYLETAAN